MTTTTTTTTTVNGKQLQAAQAAIATHSDQVRALEQQLQALDTRKGAAEARLVTAERAIARAETGLQRAREAHHVAEAQVLIATAAGETPTGDAVAAAAEKARVAERALAEARTRAAQVAAEVKRALAQLAKERADLERQHASAVALHAELEQQRGAAQAAVGRDELRRIRDEYVAIAGAMGRAYAALEAARQALGDLEANMPQRLAAWPDLRAEVERYAPTGALRSFDTLSSWSQLYGAHVSGCGKMAPIPMVQQGGTFARIQLNGLLKPYGHFGELLQQGVQNAVIPGTTPHSGPVRMLANTRHYLAPIVEAAALATRPATGTSVAVVAGDDDGDDTGGGNAA